MTTKCSACGGMTKQCSERFYWRDAGNVFDLRVKQEAQAILTLLINLADEACGHDPMPYCPQNEARAILGRIQG